MADLFNQQISATYSGLLKTTSSGVLSASLAQITDGRGNVSQLYLSTTSVQFYGLYTFPNSNGSDGQVLKTDGAGVLTWEDDIASNQLDTAGNTGTGSINLNTQSLTLTGTVNEITTNANAQSISIGFPTAGVTLPNNSIATTQLASDTSTKIATTEYVTDAIGLIPTGDVTKTGTITANQIAVWNDSTNELRSDETVTIGTDHSITLSQPNSAGADIENYNIGGGNVPNNDSSPPSTTLRKNTGFGKDNLNALTEGLYNVAVGHSSLKANTVASSNVAIGYESLLRNVDGGENVAIGLQSMHFNVSGDGNVAIGREALRKNTADKNTAVGWQTGSLNTTGQYNSYLGYLAGTYNTTGDQNVAIGSEAAYFFIGGNNTSIGAKSLLGVNGTSTGTGNTALGYNSGNAITTGSKNVIIGSNTGSTIATSDNNIIISDGDGNNRIQVDSDGNVGIGLSPSTVWSTSYNALQIGLGGSIYAHKSAGSAMRMAANVVYEGTAPNYDDKYLTTSTASKYEQDSGNHTWSTAASGTINTTIPWSERMRIDGTTGNVGIGTGSTIYADLEIKRASEVTVALHNSSSITSGNRGNISFYNSSVSTVALIKAVADTDDVGTALEFYTRPVGGSLTNSLNISSGGAATFSGNITVGDSHFIGDDSFDNFLIQSSSGENLNLSSANDVIFYTGGTSPSSLGTQRLRIFDSDGAAQFKSVKGSGESLNVKILDSNTNYAQGTGGGLLFQGIYQNNGNVAGGGAIQISKVNSNNGDYSYDMDFYTRPLGSAITKRLTISSGGDATFSNGSDASVQIGNPSSGDLNAYLKLKANGTGNAYVNSIGSGSLILGANGAASNHLSISSGGDVLIGTTDAAIKGKTTIEYGSNTTTNPTLLLRNGGGSAVFATFSTGTGATTLFGYIQRSGAGINYASNSDYRLKENVTPITDALSRVNQLKPSRFNFIGYADNEVDGFIAHEVEDIVPEAICGEKDAVNEDGTPKYQGIDQSKIVPLLTAAIQEQQTIIEDLKARIEKLEL